MMVYLECFGNAALACTSCVFAQAACGVTWGCGKVVYRLRPADTGIGLVDADPGPTNTPRALADDLHVPDAGDIMLMGPKDVVVRRLIVPRQRVEEQLHGSGKDVQIKPGRASVCCMPRKGSTLKPRYD